MGTYKIKTKEPQSTEGATDEHFGRLSGSFDQPKAPGGYEKEGVSERAKYEVLHDIPIDVPYEIQSIFPSTDAHYISSTDAYVLS